MFYEFAGGNPPPVDPKMLMDGSKKLIRGDLWTYLGIKNKRMNRSTLLIQWIASEALIIPAPTLFALKNGRKAHELLESRKSTGKIIFIP